MPEHNPSEQSAMKGDSGVSSPEDYVELAEKEAATKAVSIVMDKHLSLVLDLRGRYPLDDLDLLSLQLSKNTAIEDSVRKQVGSLQQKMRSIIEKLAEKIAANKYRSTEEAIEGKHLSLNERTRFNELIKCDKEVYQSCQSVKVTVELFLNLNKEIIHRLEESQKDGDKQTARRMILGNALLVHELLDFVISYLDRFQVMGSDEIEGIHKRALDQIQELLKDEAELERKTEAENILPAIKLQTQQEIKNRREALHAIESHWNEYLGSVHEKKEKALSILDTLPTLNLMRGSAKRQIGVLAAASVLGVVKTNLGAIETTMEALKKLELVTLSADRVRTLFLEN